MRCVEEPARLPEPVSANPSEGPRALKIAMGPKRVLHVSRPRGPDNNERIEHMDIGWYVNRLKRMSVPELAYRVQNACLARVQEKGMLVARPKAMRAVESQPGGFVKAGCRIAADHYVRAAEHILDGKLSIFALENCDVGGCPNWNRDPKLEVQAPLTFGKTLNYRDEAIVGDIKYLWEPNRHLHLVTLAQAYYLTGSSKYLDGVRDQIMGWLDQCPYLKGPNWTSSLELAIRLINWSLVWSLIGGYDSQAFSGAKGERFRDAWLLSIFQHQHFVRGHFSKFSSANNHLIGEAAGLFVAATTWPFWRESEHWAAVAKGILEEETLKQNAPDGVNLEQTTAYQQFVADFLLLSGMAGRANGVEFSASYWARLEKMMEFLASVMDSGGNVPMIGDADDGYVVKLSQEGRFCPFRSLLATGAILFDRADFKAAAGGIDDKTLWLLGEEGRARFDELEAATESPVAIGQSFADGGYFILGSDWGTGHEVKAVVDVGPLGYLSIAAHGHADALSLTLSVGGIEILVDPGTYAYHTQKKWRDYFRGTSAHNTIRVDGQDQSVIGGNFMWMAHAQARCLAFDAEQSLDRLVGEHDGYRRLPDPVTHTRELDYHKPERIFRIVDKLDCASSHHVEQFWHFAEGVSVLIEGNRICCQREGVQVSLELDKQFKNVRLVKGDEDLPLGWISRRFDIKEPSPTVVCSTRISSTTTFETTISIDQIHTGGGS